MSGTINTELVADKTIREVAAIDTAIQKEIARRGGRMVPGLSESIGIPQDVAINSMFVWKMLKKHRFTSRGLTLTVRQLNEVADSARIRFLKQHMVNHITFQIVIDYYDWLCDKKYIGRFSKTEGYWRKAEGVFRAYNESHRWHADRDGWATFLDFARLSYDNISDLVEQLEVTVRDWLIQHRAAVVATGQRDDIALLQKTVPVLLFLTSMQHHFRMFFADIFNDYGVDFSDTYSYADLTKMARNVVNMAESQGVRFHIDKDGDTLLTGVDVERSVRVNAAWNAIVRVIDNEDLAEQTTGKAIQLNPVVNRECERRMAEKRAAYEAEQEEQKQRDMEEGFKQLEENIR